VSKAQAKPEWKKAFAILAVLLFVMTPVGQHVYMSASHWVANKYVASMEHLFSKIPGATPSVTAKPSK